jgi:hypothetical protein
MYLSPYRVRGERGHTPITKTALKRRCGWRKRIHVARTASRRSVLANADITPTSTCGVSIGSLKSNRGFNRPLLRSGAMLPVGCGWCVQTVAKDNRSRVCTRTRGGTLLHLPSKLSSHTHLGGLSVAGAERRGGNVTRARGGVLPPRRLELHGGADGGEVQQCAQALRHRQRQRALPSGELAVSLSEIVASPSARRALSVTQRALSVTQRAVSITQRALSVTQRALSVTQRALSVTQRALSVTQRALSVTQRASQRALSVTCPSAACASATKLGVSTTPSTKHTSMAVNTRLRLLVPAPHGGRRFCSPPETRRSADPRSPS